VEHKPVSVVEVRLARRGTAPVGSSLSVVVVLALALLQVLPAAASIAPAKVLFVTNGQSAHESAIETRLAWLGVYTVTKMRDTAVTGTTRLSTYDLIILSEISPGVPSAGITNIINSGKPVFILEYGTFNYSYRLGLTSTATAHSTATSSIPAFDATWNATNLDIYATAIATYTNNRSPSVYGVARASVRSNAKALYYSSTSANEISALYDATNKRAALGAFQTTTYSADGWRLFDLLIQTLRPSLPAWDYTDEAWRAYGDSGLKAFLTTVRANPGRYTASQIADRIWHDTLLWRLNPILGGIQPLTKDPPFVVAWSDLHIFLPTFISSPTAGHDHQVRKTREPPIIDPPNYGVLECGDSSDTTWCEDDLWFAGRNRRIASEDDYGSDDENINVAAGGFYSWVTPELGSYLRGTDLGVSVQLGNGNVYFYMGDTSDASAMFDFDPDAEVRFWGTPSTQDCLDDGRFACDDPILVSAATSTAHYDVAPEDGIDAQLYEQWFIGDSDLSDPVLTTGFKPVLIPGVNMAESEAGIPPLPYCGSLPVPPCLGNFTTPVGAASVAINFEFEDGFIQNIPIIALWYSTATALSSTAGRSYGTSYLAFSLDGVNFGGLPGVPLSEPYGMFSQEKFLNVSPVTVTSTELFAMCADPATDDSILCDLPHLANPLAMSDNVMLVYGAGQRYRCSPLYLAVVSFPHMIVAYYHRNSVGDVSWVTSEGSATPVSPLVESDYDAHCAYTGTAPNLKWAYADTSYPDDRKFAFGELSVALVRGATPATSYLVMLSNHEGEASVQYRAASLVEPDVWTDPEATTARGYGPYIVAPYTRVDSATNDLIMYHFISAWNGYTEGPIGNGEPYGVYSRQVVLEDGSLPDWPPF
jgi:hypothetical protein